MAHDLSNVLNQESLHMNIWEEDGMWIGECTDIPGCVTQGATRNEALVNLIDAISGCLAVIAEDAGATNFSEEQRVSSLDVPTKFFSAAR
jgi:predicted RNase H-like HicB family nuclease